MADDIPLISAERFQIFHQNFNGEGLGMWDICAACGGQCELHKIGTLMPGEKHFIADQIGMALADFEATYLDRLITPRGDVDVLKLKPGCPALNSCYHCTLADSMVKPVLCDVYPVVFDVESVVCEDGTIDYVVHFSVDEIDCPLMHPAFQRRHGAIQNPQWQKYRHYFEQTGIAQLRAINCPPAWYWIVAQYDSMNFDYTQVVRQRTVPIDAYATLTLDQLLVGRIGVL